MILRYISICLILGLVAYEQSIAQDEPHNGPVISNATFEELEKENATLSPIADDGSTIGTANRLISMTYQAHVGNALHPSWKEENYSGGVMKDLKAEYPEKQHGFNGRFAIRGYTPDNYMVADHEVRNVVFVRYYFKIFKDGRPYFQPADGFDPTTKTVKVWHKVKYNLDAEKQYAAEMKRIDAEAEERRLARLAAEKAERENTVANASASSTDNTPTYSTPRPKIFSGDFGRAPLSKEMQEVVDSGNDQVEYIYETQTQCRLVADNDTAFIRSKRVCEDVQVIVGTRPK